MKKIRLFLHHHRLLTSFVILFGFLFYFSYSVYQKKDLFEIEKHLKNTLASVLNIATPKIEVDYKNVVNNFSIEKEKELEELKSLLNLTTLTSFSLENGSVITKDASHYFDIITIDKGKNSGIDVGMLAINSNGLLGVVELVTRDTSTIRLLASDNNKYKIAVSVKSGENIYNGIITGYDSSTNEIIVTSIRSQSDISLGSIVKTNGLGSLYPKGVFVGEVTNIEMDSLGVSKVLKVKSNVDFSALRYASVIKGDAS